MMDALSVEIHIVSKRWQACFYCACVFIALHLKNLPNVFLDPPTANGVALVELFQETLPQQFLHWQLVYDYSIRRCCQ
jgi:hypothetical protein